MTDFRMDKKRPIGSSKKSTIANYNIAKKNVGGIEVSLTPAPVDVPTPPLEKQAFEVVEVSEVQDKESISSSLVLSQAMQVIGPQEQEVIEYNETSTGDNKSGEAEANISVEEEFEVSEVFPGNDEEHEQLGGVDGENTKEVEAEDADSEVEESEEEWDNHDIEEDEEDDNNSEEEEPA